MKITLLVSRTIFLRWNKRSTGPKVLNQAGEMNLLYKRKRKEVRYSFYWINLFRIIEGKSKLFSILTSRVKSHEKFPIWNGERWLSGLKRRIANPLYELFIRTEVSNPSISDPPDTDNLRFQNWKKFRFFYESFLFLFRKYLFHLLIHLPMKKERRQ